MTMGLDKVAHFLGGVLLALLCWPWGPELAALVVLAVAALKEARDAYTGRGDAEALDFVATVAGGVAMGVPALLLPRDWDLYWQALLWGLWVFFVLYVVMMAAYRARLAQRLGPVVAVVLAPFLVLAFALDFVCQVTLATLVFAELPRDWLVSHRLRRYMAGPKGWRQRWASWLCTNVLDPFDPTGAHCD